MNSGASELSYLPNVVKNRKQLVKLASIGQTQQDQRVAAISFNRTDYHAKDKLKFEGQNQLRKNFKSSINFTPLHPSSTQLLTREMSGVSS